VGEKGLETGQLYLVAGRGAMMMHTPCRRTSLLLAHGNVHVWVANESILRPATDDDVAAFLAQEMPRGVACCDPLCWCNRERKV
jgi:hypothetical protein